MSHRVGCGGVVVDAKPEAVEFYEKLGFRNMEAIRGRTDERPRPVPLFLPTGAI